MLRSTRTGRDLGFKFVAAATLMGIAFRNNALYLVHPLGSGRFKTTLDVCNLLQNLSPYPIILKKVDQPLFKYLSSTGQFREPACGWELLEEEAYPEHTLQLATLYSPEFNQDPRSGSLLKKVRRFEATLTHLSPTTDLSSIDESLRGFLALFGSKADKFESYLPIIQNAANHGEGADHYKACAYIDELGIVHGLYIAERLSRAGHMGLYCAVSSRAHPGITEWMDYDFFRQLYESGTHYLHLGGSETAGVHNYVQKLLPLTPLNIMRPMEMEGYETNGFARSNLWSE
jgi:hypothetical protein